MNVFLDTSSLFKLYHREKGTDQLMRLFTESRIEKVFLSEITKVEFCSTVWKKCRTSEIETNIASVLISKFEQDSVRFSFVPEGASLRLKAVELLEKHWKSGLRTLDSLQLASALKVRGQIAYFVTSDKVLSEIALSNGFDIR